MNDAARQFFRLVKNIQHISVRIPDMKYHRLVQRHGKIHLFLQHTFLDVPWGQIIKIIQPDFAQRDGLFFFQHFRKPVKVIAGRVLRLMRMNAAGGEHVFVRVGKIKASPGRRQVAPYAHAARYAIIMHAAERFLAVLVKLFIIQVAMAVK